MVKNALAAGAPDPAEELTASPGPSWTIRENGGERKGCGPQLQLAVPRKHMTHRLLRTGTGRYSDSRYSDKCF